MKRFNIGDVLYSKNSHEVMVVDHQVIIDGKIMGCVALYIPYEGTTFGAFISYENYEMNYYEILEENNLG